MYQFFFCLYYALFTGTWDTTVYAQASNYFSEVLKFALNALGGQFTSFQQYVFFADGLTAYGLASNILAMITMFGIAFATLKVVKHVFAIFFGGR